AGTEVAHVGVAPDDDVAIGHEQRLPHGVALAGAGPELGGDFGGRDDAGAGTGGPGRRAVGRAVVDDDDLVDQRLLAHEVTAHGRDDRADRGRLVASRQAHGDPLVALGLDQAVDGELAVVEGPDGGGGHVGGQG